MFIRWLARPAKVGRTLTLPCIVVVFSHVADMRFSLSCVLAAAVGLTAAGPIPDTHAVHEKRSFEGPGSRWVKRDRVQPDTKLPMRVGLKQQNLHMGEQWLMEV